MIIQENIHPSMIDHLKVYFSQLVQLESNEVLIEPQLILVGMHSKNRSMHQVYLLLILSNK